MSLIMQTKTVKLAYWYIFQEELKSEGWNIRGYSEYNSVGIPKFAELEKEEKKNEIRN